MQICRWDGAEVAIGAAILVASVVACVHLEERVEFDPAPYLEAARRYDPTLRLVLSGTLGDGYFYYDRGGRHISQETVEGLDETIRELVREDIPFRVTSMSVIEARRLLAEAGFSDKVHLLDTHWEPNVRVVWCGDYSLRDPGTAA